MPEATPRGRGSGLAVQREYAVALYNPETGAIAHVQRSLVFEGGRDPGPSGAAARAVAVAGRAGHDIERLTALVLPDTHDHDRPHRVDLATTTAVPIDDARHG